MKAEWEKIRKLEAKIGRVNKAQEAMSSKMYDHRLKMEAILNKAKYMEEEKLEATERYDVKNRRGLTSQVSAPVPKAKPPVQSGKAIFRTRAQMAAEAEARAFGGTPHKDGPDGDTFLTDLLVGGKKQSAGGSAKGKSTKSAAKPPTHRRDGLNVDQDSEMQDLEEELRDVVFDYENSQAVVAMADNFLKGGNPKSLEFGGKSDTQSMFSRGSRASE